MTHSKEYELWDTHDWIVSMWLTSGKEYAISLSAENMGIFAPLALFVWWLCHGRGIWSSFSPLLEPVHYGSLTAEIWRQNVIYSQSKLDENQQVLSRKFNHAMQGGQNKAQEQQVKKQKFGDLFRSCKASIDRYLIVTEFL